MRAWISGVEFPKPSRALGISIFFALWAALIAGRLFWLQIVRHRQFVERAARQQQREIEVPAQRGILYDRNLVELAITVPTRSLIAIPSEMGDTKAAIADMLAGMIHTDPDDPYTSAQAILKRFDTSPKFAWIARKQDPLLAAEVIERVKDTGIRGVYSQASFKRIYPDNRLAAAAVGFVGIDDDGLAGLELSFDEDLRGFPGRVRRAFDARGHVLASVEREPLPGENLVLSIDENIQFMVERALERGMAQLKATKGTVIVQDPHTGQILAIAARPSFDPNDARHAAVTELRDPAVSDIDEPGPVFQIAVYSAALEERAIDPHSRIDCQGGQMTLFGHEFHDLHKHGILTVGQSFLDSDNIADIKLALRLGPDNLYKRIQGFGFGERTGVELPGESSGVLRDPRRWGAASIGYIAMGHEIGVTPIQLVEMTSTIAAGGVYSPARIVLESTDQAKGSARLQPHTFRADSPSPLPSGAHRVLSPPTAAWLSQMMEDQLSSKQDSAGQLEGYRAAGKGGMSQKIDPTTHTYSNERYSAAFVGFAPVRSPVISIAITMDCPKASIHDGTQAAEPLFRDVAQQVLEYLEVPHDKGAARGKSNR